MANRKKQRGQGRAPGTPGLVRIIGGDWRGRRLPVLDAPGLRPSGDRVRETLFNWLQPEIHGRRCADLFAGTGVLGFEAASRGARSVTLVEKSPRLAAMLRESQEMLAAGQVSVVNADALEWLAGQPPESLDLVFVDPPFDSDLAGRALAGLADSACLAPGALVYLEHARLDDVRLPPAFLQRREKVLGEVSMTLFEMQDVR